MNIKRLTGAFAAEVRGADVTHAPDAADVGRLLLEHRVVVVRDQELSPSEHIAFARQLGEPTLAHPVVPGPADHPEVLVLDAEAGGKNARWHTDVTFVAAPPKVSILYAELLPEFGGDTSWADMRTAYESLAAPMRDLVDVLDAVHRISPLAYWGEPFDTALTRDDAQDLFAKAAQMPAVVHPVVRVHPETGARNLFVNPGFTTHILGLSRVESDGLLSILYSHATKPEHVYRHRWERNDLVLWDNRTTMHYAADDYAPPRIMRRVTLRGDAPVGANGTVSHVVDDPLIAIR